MILKLQSAIKQGQVIVDAGRLNKSKNSTFLTLNFTIPIKSTNATPFVRLNVIVLCMT